MLENPPPTCDTNEKICSCIMIRKWGKNNNIILNRPFPAWRWRGLHYARITEFEWFLPLLQTIYVLYIFIYSKPLVHQAMPCQQICGTSPKDDHWILSSLPSCTRRSPTMSNITSTIRSIPIAPIPPFPTIQQQEEGLNYTLTARLSQARLWRITSRQYSAYVYRIPRISFNRSMYIHLFSPPLTPLPPIYCVWTGFSSCEGCCSHGTYPVSPTGCKDHLLSSWDLSSCWSH